MEFPSVSYGDWIDSWYTDYKEKSGKRVTKNAFGKMLGEQGFPVLRDKYMYNKEEGATEQLLDTVAKLGDNVLLTTLRLSMFCAKREKTIKDCLQFMNSEGKLAQQDVDDYTGRRLTQLSISAKAAIAEIVSQADQLQLQLNLHEKNYIASDILDSLPIEYYSIVFSHETVMNMIPDFRFKQFVFDVVDAIGESKINITKDGLSYWMFKKAVEQNIVNYDSISELIINIEFMDTYERWNEKNPLKAIRHAKTDADRYIATALWLGNTDLIEDKYCLDFFHQHCKSGNVKTGVNAVSKDDYLAEYFPGRHRAKSEEGPDISRMLTSQSMLAPPVLASYLLYNIASTDFKVERFYALLYVIQKMEVLKPLIKKLEPLYNINVTKKYNQSDLVNPLVANFVLMSKISLISDDTDDYFNFLNELFMMQQYALVMGEASRIIEMVGMSCNATKIDRLLIGSIQSISQGELEKLDKKTIKACYLLLMRSGICMERLRPYLDAETLSTYDKFDDARVRKFFDNRDEYVTSLYQPIIEFFPRSSVNLGPYRETLPADIEYRYIASLIAESNGSVETLRHSLEIKGPQADTLDFNRRNPYFRESVNRDNETKVDKIIKNLHGFGHTDKDVIGLVIYLFNNNITSKRWFKQEDRGTGYVFKQGKLIIPACISVQHMITLMLKHKPTDVDVVKLDNYWTNYSGYTHRTREEENTGHAKYDVLSFSNINTELYEVMETFIWLRGNLYLNQFKNHNPFAAEIEKHLPTFYFMNKQLNSKGTDYSLLKT